LKALRTLFRCLLRSQSYEESMCKRRADWANAQKQTKMGSFAKSVDFLVAKGYER